MSFETSENLTDEEYHAARLADDRARRERNEKEFRSFLDGTSGPGKWGNAKKMHDGSLMALGDYRGWSITFAQTSNKRWYYRAWWKNGSNTYPSRACGLVFDTIKDAREDCRENIDGFMAGVRAVYDAEQAPLTMLEEIAILDSETAEALELETAPAVAPEIVLLGAPRRRPTTEERYDDLINPTFNFERSSID